MKYIIIVLKIINPYFWYKSYRKWRADRRSRTVSDFAHRHKELMVIVLDPVEDTMFIAHRDKQILTKIKTADGKTHHIVKNVVKASQFKSNIDYLLTAMLEGLRASLDNPAVNQFIKWLDAAVYRIGQDLKLRKEEKIKRQKQ